MTASAGYDPRRSTGYRIEQLAGAFDRVRDPADWQAPVWAVIVADERPLVEKAVLWFTESEPVFERVPGSEELLVVKAPGYRQAPAKARCHTDEKRGRS
jgi:hypothetical protein